MKKGVRVLLIIIAVASFAIALSYPIKYFTQKQSNENTMDRLIAMRNKGLQEAQQAQTSQPEGDAEMPLETAAPQEDAKTGGGQTMATAVPEETALPEHSSGEKQPEPTEVPITPGVEVTAAPTTSVSTGTGQPANPPADTTAAPVAAVTQAAESANADETAVPVSAATQAPVSGNANMTTAPAADNTPEPEPTVDPNADRYSDPNADRYYTGDVLSYPQKKRVVLIKENILPQYREIYEENHDLVGWLTIPGTEVDYPVVQNDDNEYYLTHDFYGRVNANGQLILDANCDPYTPSYNLIISGHNMLSGEMFGHLTYYHTQGYWEKHKTVLFDTLMEQKEYVIFAAFFSADYDEDEEGFRYNVDIQYAMDAYKWLQEIKENQVYDTGIDAEFGDEFLTLTTCSKMYQKNGRFVLVCRRVREGEKF